MKAFRIKKHTLFPSLTLAFCSPCLTPVIGNAAKSEDQPIPASAAPIHKKKWTWKTGHLVKEDEAGPSQEREEEEEPEQEVTTQSLSLSELQDILKYFSYHPGAHNIPALEQTGDNRANSLELENREAKQLGSLSSQTGIDKAIGRTGVLSFWKQLLSSIKGRCYMSPRQVDCSK